MGPHPSQDLRKRKSKHPPPNLSSKRRNCLSNYLSNNQWLNQRQSQQLNLKLNLNQRKLKKSPHQNPNQKPQKHQNLNQKPQKHQNLNQKPLKHQNLNQNRSPKQQQRNRALRSTKHALRKRNGCQPTSTPVPRLSSNVLVEDSVSNGGKLKEADAVSHPSPHTNASTFMRHPPTHLLKTHKHGNVSFSATVVSVYGLQIGGVGLAYDF